MAIRKNVATLSSGERAACVAALKKMKSMPSRFTPPTASRYDDFVYIHMQAMLVFEIKDRSKPVTNGNWTLINDMRMPMWAHRCPAFLPWHREFLLQFERELQTAANSPSLGLPYWNWSVDQSPAGAPWTDDLLGGDGMDGPVTTGPFAGKTNWPLTLSEDGVDELIRGFGRDTTYGKRLPNQAEEAATLAMTPYDGAPWSDTEATFRNELEGWLLTAGSDLPVGMHNLVHIWVGGTKGSMLPSTSPNDPVFFLHHSNIDRLWAKWQRAHPSGPLYLPGTPLPEEPGQGVDEPMIFYDPALSTTAPWPEPAAKPSDVIDHHRLGYSYDDDPPLIALGPAIAITRDLALRRPSAESMHIDARKQKPLTIAARDRFKLRLDELDEQRM
jgi:tyrosinase